jgi:hypothetical protein
MLKAGPSLLRARPSGHVLGEVLLAVLLLAAIAFTMTRFPPSPTFARTQCTFTLP